MVVSQLLVMCRFIVTLSFLSNIILAYILHLMNLPYIGADKKPCIYVTMTTANRTAQIELK